MVCHQAKEVEAPAEPDTGEILDRTILDRTGTIRFHGGLIMAEVVGIGTEITECLRIARLIERHGEVFLRRVYTDEEIRFCNERRHATQHFTGRWVAKEAVLKALGVNWQRGIAWRDIEIRAGEGGQPVVALRGAIRDVIEQRGIRDLRVSISYCRSHAVAFAMAMTGQ